MDARIEALGDHQALNHLKIAQAQQDQITMSNGMKQQIRSSLSSMEKMGLEYPALNLREQSNEAACLNVIGSEIFCSSCNFFLALELGKSVMLVDTLSSFP